MESASNPMAIVLSSRISVTETGSMTSEMPYRSLDIDLFVRNGQRLLVASLLDYVELAVWKSRPRWQKATRTKFAQLALAAFAFRVRDDDEGKRIAIPSKEHDFHMNKTC